MHIAVLGGDGIGPEVVSVAVRVLQALERHGVRFEFSDALIGAAARNSKSTILPQATLSLAQRADAILFGSVGGSYDEDSLPRGHRPGDALLTLRKTLGLYGNFRPAIMYPELLSTSTLKREVVEGLDIVILRELNGDIYFGEPRGIVLENNKRLGYNTMRYTEDEVARIAHMGFRAAQRRRRKLCSVDKANVLETSELWRSVVTEVGRSYPDVELTHLYIDAAAMMLVRKPTQFDVIVTGNIFGDILSDEAAMLTGSIGMLPSASLGDGTKGLYEPVHGSAPDIAGQDLANPLAAVLSAAMMLRWSFAMEAEAMRIENAVRGALARGYRTRDLAEPGARLVGTTEMGAAVAELI